MNVPRVVIAADYDGVSRAAAEIVDEAVRTAPRVVLALPTGATPVGMYAALATLHRERGTDWSQATTFNLDEYCDVSPDDPESYAYYMGQHLFAAVNLAPERRHLPDGRAPDAEAEALRYERAIDEAGGIDLAVLGVGVNGHLGFNEPGEALTPQTHVAELAEDTWRRNFPHLAETFVPVAATAAGGRPYHRAFTMGIGTILQARRVLLLATGAEKRTVLRAALEGPVTTHVPASLLRLHRDVRLVVDRVAWT